MFFVFDICGILCVCLSWCLILFAQYSVITCIILPEQDKFYETINFIIFETLILLASASHLKCVFTDPGRLPKGSATRAAIESLGLSEDRILFKCQKCCSIKPERAHHCSVCKRCILKMDHHCPWTNNCVGERTQKYFILFTFYIALVSVYTLVITLLHLMKNCIKNDYSYCDCKPLFSIFSTDHFLATIDPKSTHASPYSIILIIVLIFESVLFGIFAFIMFFCQIQGVFNDETGIESLKKKNINRRFKNRSFMKRFKLILSDFNLNWLNPFISPNVSSSFDFKNYTHYV